MMTQSSTRGSECSGHAAAAEAGPAMAPLEATSLSTDFCSIPESAAAVRHGDATLQYVKIKYVNEGQQRYTGNENRNRINLENMRLAHHTVLQNTLRTIDDSQRSCTPDAG